MAKTLLSMQALRWWALEEIRQRPGCSSVASIAINPITDDRAESNWSMCVVSAGAADPNTAARAAIHVQQALRRATPTARYARELRGITEVRSEVFMFGDLFQAGVTSAVGRGRAGNQ